MKNKTGTVAVVMLMMATLAIFVGFIIYGVVADKEIIFNEPLFEHEKFDDEEYYYDEYEPTPRPTYSPRPSATPDSSYYGMTEAEKVVFQNKVKRFVGANYFFNYLGTNKSSYESVDSLGHAFMLGVAIDQLSVNKVSYTVPSGVQAEKFIVDGKALVAGEVIQARVYSKDAIGVQLNKIFGKTKASKVSFPDVISLDGNDNYKGRTYYLIGDNYIYAEDSTDPHFYGKEILSLSTIGDKIYITYRCSKTNSEGIDIGSMRITETFQKDVSTGEYIWISMRDDSFLDN